MLKSDFFKCLYRMLIFCAIMFYTHTAFCEIAFVANVDNNWDLYVMEGPGAPPVRLTQTGLDEKDPAWSPTGPSLIYATSDGNLNTLDLKTKQSRIIAVTQRKTAKVTPSVSPDGTQVAFAQFRSPDQGDDTDLMMFDMKTGQAFRVLDQPAIQMWPAWSPDGTRLVYSQVHCSFECGRLIQELWVASPLEHWSRQLLMTHSNCQQPVWSKDGHALAFSSDKEGNQDIWVVDLTTWSLKQMTNHGDMDVKPAWSPDDSTLAFVSTRSGTMEIWLKQVKNGGLSRLTPFKNKSVPCKDVIWW